MTDKRWELPVVVIVSCTTFFAIWHLVEWLLR
jgi:hypothetical protein